jgi:hypothetical protein
VNKYKFNRQPKVYSEIKGKGKETLVQSIEKRNAPISTR